MLDWAVVKLCVCRVGLIKGGESVVVPLSNGAKESKAACALFRLAKLSLPIELLLSEYAYHFICISFDKILKKRE